MPFVSSSCRLSGVTERIQRVLVAFKFEGYRVIHPGAVVEIFPKDKLKLVRNIFRNKLRLGYLSLVAPDTYQINDPYIVTRLPRAFLADGVFRAMRKNRDKYLTPTQIIAEVQKILGRKTKNRASVSAVLSVWHRHGAVLCRGKSRLNQTYRLSPEARRRPTLVR